MDSPSQPISAYDSETFGKDASFRVDKPVGSASISPCGRDVVLASRQGLHIIDLDSPWSPPRHLPHHTPWEVADVQWSPNASRDHWVVSTSNQKALVWNLAMTNPQSSIEHVLHAHTRAITDINFSGFHPDILATCAVDSFVHCWDLRHPARPAMTFCDWFAGATQVKWNRRDSHILASSHDKFLRIWDERKGAYPLRSIEAHATKIYGVDWSRLENSLLVTCSLDKTIKFWDYNSNNDEPERIIDAPFPVWRARHTPFGSGLLALPQRGDHDLHLYDRRLDEIGQFKGRGPVHQFGGHQNEVKEFLWRARGNVTENADHRDFQLVSWGTDKMLRLHGLDEEVAANVGYVKGMEVKRTVIFTRRDAKYKTFRDDPNQQVRKLSQDSGLGIHSNYGENGRGMRSALSRGMSSSSTPFIGGYGNSGFMSSTLGTKSSSSKDIDPIAWMQGVKIGKRETSPPGMHKSVSTIMSPGSRTDPTWDRFDSLGEEITSAGARFPRVAFDEIDVQRRRIAVSLSGPWGLENTSSHIRLSIDFPAEYPMTAAPVITLKNSPSVIEETAVNLSTEVNIIAESFMADGRHSLEATLRHLLGEQSLDESLNWLKKHRESDVMDSTQETGFSSSDEDDEDLGVPHALESSDPTLAASNAQYNVPLPKACGALWANSGLLVCFFPAKQDKDGSLLDHSLNLSDRPYRSRKAVFEGFGRLRVEPKRLTSTLGTIESDASDSADFISSSSGSTSSSIDNTVGYHFLPSIAWRGNAHDAHQDFSLDESQRSVGDNGPGSALTTKANIFISIHDYIDLLPSKPGLALKYQIGNTSQIAAHNALVAEDIGDSDLANIWSLVELLLKEVVPLNPPLRPKDSAVDLSFDYSRDDVHPTGRLPVSWDDHPFGRQWLVESLFCHFEQQADIQMLAMLSCVLSEPERMKTLPGREKEEDWNAVGPWNPTQDFNASETVAASINSHRVSGLDLSINVDSHKIHSGPHSATSSNGATGSDTLGISSGSGTPPLFKAFRTDLERKENYATSASTSPEMKRQGSRPGANMKIVAPLLPRPLRSNQSAASSPPKFLNRKRHSPANSYLGAAQSGVAGFFSKSSTALESHTSASSLSFSDSEDDMPSSSPPKKPTFSTKLTNQDQFHHEDHVAISLLDPKEDSKYRGYREAYAHMLYVWGMPLASLEMLNQGRSTSKNAQPLALGKISPKTAELSHMQNIRINLVGHCTSCSAILPNPEESKKCPQCHNKRSPLICLLCNAIIRGRFSPCLKCGHLMHDACRRAVFSSDAGIDECISGCGCRCFEHTSVEMAMPEEHPSPVLTITNVHGKYNRRDRFDSMGSGEWEHVAYMSLARNLKGEGRGGEKGLGKRPSSIWRG